MSLVLLNLQSNQQIKLDSDNPLIIGRGNVVGCFDKRVSRNHGRITCTLDGKIRLEALHCNPCFFTRNGVPPVLQLNKDEEEILNEGDCLGLLPNAFWFQVKLISEIKIKNEPEDIDSENLKLNNDDSLVSDVLTKRTDELMAHANAECMPDENKDSSLLVPSSSEGISNSAGTSKTFGSPEFEKTRRLPLHMYEIDELISPVERNKSATKHKLKTDHDVENKVPKLVSEIKKEPNFESEDRKLEDEFMVTNVASTSKPEIVDKSTSSPKTDLGTTNQAEGESSKSKQKEGYESDVEMPPKRPICQYEGNCYRKNPQHKLEFCHPGDADYVPYEERPECQYGTACYRRNERHRVEYKHSLPGSSFPTPAPSSPTSLASSPLPVKRRREKVKKQNFDYDDEYDLEDPFINDASSDEYVPSDWDSEEEGVESSDTSQEGER